MIVYMWSYHLILKGISIISDGFMLQRLLRIIFYKSALLPVCIKVGIH